MRTLLLGVAAAALTVSGANAAPGKDKGQGQEHSEGHAGSGKPAKGNPDHGNAKTGVGQPDKPGRPEMARQDHGKTNKPDKMTNGPPGGDRSPPAKSVGNGNVGKLQIGSKDHRWDDSRRDSRHRRYGDDIFGHWDDAIRSRGLLDGCPPGLAKKHNGCNPPGLVKRDLYRYDRATWWGLPGLLDGRYRYYGGNLVRLSAAGLILGYYPLLGGGLSVGNRWPSWYDSQPLPSYYEDYYGLGPAGNYRYADNVLYRVNPETAAITSIAALLAGDTIRVGQRMPAGYGIYNVPYGYRDRYVDRPDAIYRYSDGYVYEIDPTTMLVASAIELLI